MRFNEEQNLAVTHTDGPCMVLAGPGSGKTTVIVNRIRFLTGECGVSPEKILVITFTRTAAREMQERYRILAGGEQGVSFGTFHALFYKILRWAYHYDMSAILAEDERNRFIKLAAEKAGIESYGDNNLIFTLSNEISCLKNSGADPDGFNSSVTDRKTFRIIYEEFERMLRSEMKIDFDDMLLLCSGLFDEKPEVLEFWRGIYEYVLIDEFQDICPLQYRLTKRLCALHNNIFVVGDDDQSIYSFRGADPGMLFEFEKDFGKCPGYEKIILGVNYRCSPEISEHSIKLISHNKKRYRKNIRSGRTSVPRTSTVLFREFGDIKNESEYIAVMIEELLKKGIDQSEIAVLYRVNTQPGALISRLKEKNIRFCLRDNVPNIYEHWIALNIFAYIELALIERPQEDRGRWRELFLQIANRPSRYITRDVMRKRELDFDILMASYKDRQYVRDRIEKLKYDLYIIKKLDPKAAVKYIRRAVGYDDFLDKYANERNLDREGLFEILDEIEASSAEFATYADWKKHIADYTEALKARRFERQEKEKEAGVSLLTYHSAKGLEFDTVFVMDLCEGGSPHRQAVSKDEIEEERRMFYVAVTRAKNRLFLTFSSDRRGKKQIRSRFIKELGL